MGSEKSVQRTRESYRKRRRSRRKEKQGKNLNSWRQSLCSDMGQTYSAVEKLFGIDELEAAAADERTRFRELRSGRSRSSSASSPFHIDLSLGATDVRRLPTTAASGPASSRTESWQSIAVRYGVLPTAIKAANGVLSEDSLFLRKFIAIPIKTSDTDLEHLAAIFTNTLSDSLPEPAGAFDSTSSLGNQSPRLRGASATAIKSPRRLSGRSDRHARHARDHRQTMHVFEDYESEMRSSNEKIAEVLRTNKEILSRCTYADDEEQGSDVSSNITRTQTPELGGMGSQDGPLHPLELPDNHLYDDTYVRLYKEYILLKKHCFPGGVDRVLPLREVKLLQSMDIKSLETTPCILSAPLLKCKLMRHLAPMRSLIAVAEDSSGRRRHVYPKACILVYLHKQKLPIAFCARQTDRVLDLMHGLTDVDCLRLHRRPSSKQIQTTGSSAMSLDEEME